MLIYRILSSFLFLFFLPVYAVIRIFKGKELSGWHEKLWNSNIPNLGDKIIMFHGVSVGEVIALENLIKKTSKIFPDYRIVVTTGTVTGQQVAKKKFDNIADFITYFPFDISLSVKKFLDSLNPSVVLIAETELWPVFAYYCKKRYIPLFVINGRISDSTFKFYKLVKFFFKELFKNYSGIYTQSNDDRQKFIQIGAPEDKTEVMKNLKFDVKRIDAKFNLGSGRIIIAGSTHKGEDIIVLNSFSVLKKEFNNIKLLIAPRHLTRVDEVLKLAIQTGLNVGLRSKNDTFDNNDIIILDTLGELSKIYQVCDVAFIGGSFNKTGGHNPLEAVVYQKPVISGPIIHNFKDIYKILESANAAKIVKNENEFTDYLRIMLFDNNFYNQRCLDCKKVFEEQQGALDFVIYKLKEIL